MHQKVECTECHVKLVFTDVGTKCADCHADIHRRQMGANCEQCHTVQGWDVSIQAIQNHQNRFPLIGAHAAVDCDSCHTGAATGQFQGLSTQCYSCHAKDFQSTTNPNHVAGQFSTNCQMCHSVNSWLGASFDHSLTGFPLTGAHLTVACASCHVNNNYSLTSANTACAICHMPDFQSTTNPNHVAGGFATTCQTCHTTTAWQPANFDHNATGFPLTGAHVSVACASCHVNNNYNLTAANAACSACHLTDFQNTTNPNHAQTGIPTTCQVCHTTSAWQPATFDHNATGFPLTGAHVAVACNLVPRQQQLQPDGHTCVLGLPHAGLSGHHESQPRASGVPEHLPDLPYDHRLAARELRSQHDRIHADRGARDGGVHLVPREQQLQLDRGQHDLRQLPPDRLQQRREPRESHSGWLPDDLCDLPRHDRSGPTEPSITRRPAGL